MLRYSCDKCGAGFATLSNFRKHLDLEVHKAVVNQRRKHINNKNQKGSQDSLSSLESDQMHNMFLEWAKKKDKTYESVEEQERRFKIWINTKMSIDQLYSLEPGYKFSINYMNSVADMSPLEGMNMLGATASKDQYASLWLYVCSSEVEKELEAREKAKGNQDPLSIFLNWINVYGKKYETEEEIAKRFEIWCEKKKKVDQSFSHLCNYTFSIAFMHRDADLTPSDKRLPKGELDKLNGTLGELVPIPENFGLPPEEVVALWNSKEGLELVEKGKILFDKWAVRHKRDYGSWEEREKRFMAYMQNMIHIFLDDAINPRHCWTYGYDLENMDKYGWEATLI